MLKEPLKQVGKGKLSVYQVVSCASNEDKSFLVNFEGGYSANLNAEEVLKFDLYDTDEPGKIPLSQLIFEINYGRARMVAASLARASRKPTRVLEDKLYTMRFSNEIVTKVIESLTTDGLLNDMKFAIKFAEKKAQEKSASKRQIIMLIMSKGIDRETAEKAMDTIDYDDKDAAINVACKLAKTGADCDKVFRSLASKGFDRRVGEIALEKAFPEDLK